MEGLKCKNEKKFKNAKAKHGLNSIIWIRLIGLSFLRDQKRREEKRRGEEEEDEEEEKKKRREEEKKSKKVWNLTFSMDFLVWIHVLGCGL